MGADVPAGATGTTCLTTAATVPVADRMAFATTHPTRAPFPSCARESGRVWLISPGPGRVPGATVRAHGGMPGRLG